MRVLALVKDSFGGHGGIALYNRDMLTAMCLHPSRPQVVAVPRTVVRELEALPSNLAYLDYARQSKVTYAATVLATLARHPRPDLILCSHIHLLPLAEIARRISRAPLILFVYGVDAWAPTRHWLANVLVRNVDAVISIRQLTTTRLRSWAKLNGTPDYTIENPIHLEHYGVGPKNPELLRKFGLEGKTVVMTMGRVEEARKGFDEILEAMPDLRREIPDVAYLVAGGGHDLPRIRRKALDLGVADRVAFTDLIPESSKADHYRLADVFAMPGSAPRFDRYPLRFVFLEALACGVPVVGSVPDEATLAAQAADLPITFVDPLDRTSIVNGIKTALSRPSGGPSAGLQRYAFESFTRRLHSAIDDALGRAR